MIDAVFMQDTHPTFADVPGLLAMAVCYLIFASIGIFWPEKLRSMMDRFSDSWKKNSWHPYRMPLNVLRWVVGTVGIAGAVLFIYIAYVGFTR